MNSFFSKYSFVLLAASLLIFTACAGSDEEGENMSEMDDTEAVTEAQESQVSEQSANSTPTSDTANKTVDGKLNINTATGEAFRSIPNVGDKMVHEFEEYRPYVSIQQFRKEIGKYVDEEQVAEYEKYIYVPIDRNNSDAATLMQISGLDEGEANELISKRPYRNNPSLIGAMQPMVTAQELETAKGYLKAEEE